MILRKGPDRTVQMQEWKVRVGDFVALMICANYKKTVEGYKIFFQLMDDCHKSLKVDVLYKNVIDEILLTEGPGWGLRDPQAIEVYDPGPLWVASTYYHQVHGPSVMPRLHLDPAHYQGPELAWNSYLVFHPLFDPPYNGARGMEETFVNELCDKLHQAFGDRAIVITDKPEKIRSDIKVIHTHNLYDIIYLISNALAYIGGDTGLTHFAAAARVRNLFALYGPNYARDFGATMANLCHDEIIHPFTAVGAYWGTGMDFRPKCDPMKTRMHFQLLHENKMSGEEMDALIDQVQDCLF
jgi:hypothetical protein